MDIEVERCADVGMAQQDAYRFVVTAAFDAAGGKTVPEAVEMDGRKSQFPQDTFKISPVWSGLCGFTLVGKYIVMAFDTLFQGPEQVYQIWRQGDVPVRADSFGRIHHYF